MTIPKLKSAFESVFPSASVFLCDFHREQAWTRWVRDRKHGLTDEEGKELLSLLRDCTWASAPEDEGQPLYIDYRKAKTKLQASRVFKKHVPESLCLVVCKLADDTRGRVYLHDIIKSWCVRCTSFL